MVCVHEGSQSYCHGVAADNVGVMLLLLLLLNEMFCCFCYCLVSVI